MVHIYQLQLTIQLSQPHHQEQQHQQQQQQQQQQHQQQQQQQQQQILSLRLAVLRMVAALSMAGWVSALIFPR